jgi:acetolactate synthase-1/2/3 large subunit
MTGGERLCRVLEDLGVDTVFGLPGTQNVDLFEALRTSWLRTVVPTHELAASFMANGYARASGRPGVLVTIPGPGFTYALTGLAEAFLDSVPLLHILGRPAQAPGQRYQLQALDQRAAVAPFVKRVFDVENLDEIEAAAVEAHAVCLSGEPGPVVLQIPNELTAVSEPRSVLVGPAPPPTPLLGELESRLTRARRPLFYVGQGAFGAASDLRELVESMRIPVVTTTSGRGALPESHPWAIPFDRGSTDALNELVESTDLVLAIAAKFSHNGARGFRLKLPPDRLVRVDASPEVLEANYAASMLLLADAPWLIRTLRDHMSVSGHPGRSAWTEEQIADWRQKAFLGRESGSEMRVRGGLEPPTMSHFFGVLERAMGAESSLVLDSGLHQMLARRHFRVERPRGLILPADLQAMGYALPAAIGAKLAVPDRRVVALLGDGGFAMSGLELSTAKREGVHLTVIVFNDGHYGMIRKQQFGAHGHVYGTQLRNPDFRQIAESVGAEYTRLDQDAETRLAEAVRSKGVHLVEVRLRDPGRRKLRRVRYSLSRRLRNLLGG